VKGWKRKGLDGARKRREKTTRKFGVKSGEDEGEGEIGKKGGHSTVVRKKKKNCKKGNAAKSGRMEAENMEEKFSCELKVLESEEDSPLY